MGRCKLCGGTNTSFARANILYKYDVEYVRCEACGFVQTETPFWLEEAYGEVINGSDIGLVSRNLRLAGMARAVIAVNFNADGKFLDYGGGYGLFVRLMRDAGYDFYYYDKHPGANIFARGMEREPDQGASFEVVTAFEVLEHLPDPVTEVARMLSLSKSLLVTTQLLPSPAPKPAEWWYYGLDHGQHVSFFTMESLSKLAERFSLNLYTDNRDFHLLTDRKLNPALFRFIANNSGRRLVNMFYKRRSLADADYTTCTGKNGLVRS